MGNRLRLNSRQNDVVAIRNDHGTRASSVRSINQHMAVSGLLYNSLDRRGFRAYDRNNPVRRHDVTESNVNEFDCHNQVLPPILATLMPKYGRSFDIRRLLANLLQFRLHFDNTVHQSQMVGF